MSTLKVSPDFSIRLQAAMGAVEEGDKAADRGEVAVLSDPRTPQAIVALVQLARELSSALGELATNDQTLAELPDASARLDHVVELTETATHRTLDLVEQCRAIANTVIKLELNDKVTASLGQLRELLSEVALAQSYQDLTGQTIRRVARLVKRVNAALATLGLSVEADAKQVAQPSGPIVPGLDHHGVSQEDADSLISDLGI